MILRFTLLMSVILSLSMPVLNAAEPPTNAEVKEALEKLISSHQEFQYKEKKDTFKSPSGLLSFLQIIPLLIYYLRYPILIVIIGIFLYFIYIILKDMTPYFKKNREYRQPILGEENQMNLEQYSYYQLYQMALGFAEKRELNKAVIYLQKSAIEFLRKSVVLNTALSYTNNDIKRIILKDPHYEDFCSITISAEKACFSRYRIDNSEYQFVLQKFKNSFMGKE